MKMDFVQQDGTGPIVKIQDVVKMDFVRQDETEPIVKSNVVQQDETGPFGSKS